LRLRWPAYGYHRVHAGLVRQGWKINHKRVLRLMRGENFLDEIGELPLNLQPKLLRVLQEHAFERVGGNGLVQSDFRLIAATNCDLADAVKDVGHFRQDLYYRLNAFTIELPPLRERRADIVPLAEHLRDLCAAKNKVPVAEFSEEALMVLQQYSYPGNVRELEHIVERALLQAQGRLILPEHLLLQSQAGVADKGMMEALAKLPLQRSVAEWEKFRISKALQDSNGNKTEAARQLGIHRRLLYEKIRKLGLETANQELGGEG
jgi:DNA-binding NtrC family response regulator